MKINRNKKVLQLFEFRTIILFQRSVVASTTTTTTTKIRRRYLSGYKEWTWGHS